LVDDFLFDVVGVTRSAQAGKETDQHLMHKGCSGKLTAWHARTLAEKQQRVRTGADVVCATTGKREVIRARAFRDIPDLRRPGVGRNTGRAEQYAIRTPKSKKPGSSNRDFCLNLLG
ncbi:hypothetical protein, partial [Burkholderia seminalis]|uniref:hypothetical protein n=1 Tax=Burkholderia seminalis TaxID=488731 RepID=UPI0019D32B50